MEPRFFKLRADKESPFCFITFEDSSMRECSTIGRSVLDGRGPAKCIFRDFGSAWVDVCRTENTGYLVVSEKVADALVGFSGVQINSLEVTGVESRSLRKKEMPRYYWMKATGSIAVDLDAIGLTGQPILEDGRRSMRGWRPDLGQVIPLAETWSGDDMSAISTLSGHGYVCTRAIVDAAYSGKWTNALVSPLDSARSRIDMRTKTWPPESWYHPGESADPRNLN